jgi:two-component system, response regulator PdtaR
MRDREAIRRCILLVEDEPLVALDVQLLLEDAGYRVLGPAGTVASALALAADTHINGAILDLNLMGEMTSPVVEVLREASVPIVLVTGYTSQTLHPPFVGLPVLHKPHDSRELLATLEQAIAAGALPQHPAVKAVGNAVRAEPP